MPDSPKHGHCKDHKKHKDGHGSDSSDSDHDGHKKVLKSVYKVPVLPTKICNKSMP